MFDVHSSHSVGEALLKSGLNAAALLGRQGLSKAVKSDFAKKKIKDAANRYLDQALDSFITDLSKKISPTGGAIHIHKAIGKLPRPAREWTLPGHKYTGPYNDLYSQVKFDPQTGQILEIYDQPIDTTDAIAMQHDIDYSVCKDDKKCKNEADRRMAAAMDNVLKKDRK